MRSFTKFAFVLLFIITSFHTFAQKNVDFESGPSFTDRVYKGGNFSLQFGTITFVDVSPLSGFMLNEMLSAGVGFTYRYLNYRFNNFDTNIYGYRVFLRHNLNRNIFLYTEYENLSVEFFSGDGVFREWIPGGFLGAGYHIGSPNSNFATMITGMYNFSYNLLKSPYNSEWVFRVGILF